MTKCVAGQGEQQSPHGGPSRAVREGGVHSQHLVGDKQGPKLRRGMGGEVIWSQGAAGPPGRRSDDLLLL